MNWRNQPTQTQLSSSVNTCLYFDQTIVRVAHPLLQGAVSLHGAHLIDFQPTNQNPIIWMSDNALFQKDKAIRGGVPVCWPWFGKSGNPSHGFARTQTWKLDKHQEDDLGITLELVLTESEESLAIWANRFHNRLVIRFNADSVALSLITTNNDSHEWQYGGALHTYLTVDNIANVEISQLGEQYLDSTNSLKQCASDGTLTINKEIDRVYTHVAQPVKLQDGQRQLLVEHHGGDSVVVWNPWAELCQNMVDMTDEAYQTMVCIESAQAKPSIVLQPKESHTIHTEIRLVR